MGVGVANMITSLLTRWPVAAWAGGTDVAMASMAEAFPSKALWDGKMWMVKGIQLGIKLILNLVSFGLDGTVNSILPRGGGVTA